MDIDLNEYDQMDEAKYLMELRGAGGMQGGGGGGGDLLTTLSSEKANSIELTNCENDFVFLPAPSINSKHTGNDNATTTNIQAAPGNSQQSQDINIKNLPTEALETKVITPDQLDTRSHKHAFSLATAVETIANANTNTTITGAPIRMIKESNPSRPDFIINQNSQNRLAKPLMSINSNVSNNPFFNLQQVSPDTAVAVTSQPCQPFWMRSENFANTPIGVLDQAPNTSATDAGHLSDLMHQIITKSDSIFIAIPCLFCHDSKACPPSDISAWLSHMNRAHNCKICPICNKLVGLGPMRDIEIMRKHVVSHIDEEWLERRSAKTNFSFGLQQQWFSSGRCNVKDPRTSLSKH